MRLKTTEIMECLEEHKTFVDNYLSPECYVSFTSNKKHYNMTLKEFFDSTIENVSPNREKFFESIATRNSNLKNSKILEIGVANGSNAMRIYNSLKPKKMWLIDPWINQNKRSADRGHSKKVHNEAYESTKKRFGNLDVQIVKDFAENVVDLFEDEFFDFIYIDGDHSYHGCKKDLNLYYPKLKTGGFFGGHDFTGNWNSLYNKSYGVQKAVGEFLLENNKKLDFITTCIETKKPDLILPFDWGFIK